MKCLWCEKEFVWDKTIYRFCDNCQNNLNLTEGLAGDPSITDRLEKCLMKKLKEI